MIISVAPVIHRVAAPLRDQVVEALRTEIITGALRPGQRLIERELIEALDVSRTTVREALTQLATEGLVTMLPQRGAIVTVLRPEDIADLYDIRAMLEGMLVGRFVEVANDEQHEQLQGAIERFVRACRSGDPLADQLVEKDHVYEILIDGAASEVLRQLLGSIQARVQFARASSMTVPGRAHEVATEFEQLGSAIRRLDKDRAVELARTHVLRARRSVLASLEQGVIA